jgi:hypothetical protein
MCHQSVGLVQSVVEHSGIPTVSITLLREVTERVRPPRALFVDLPLGFPLGHPDDVRMQTTIIMAALDMLSQHVAVPVIREWRGADFKRRRAGGSDQ